MHPMLNIAVKAARRAGAIINRAARDVDLVPVSRKGHANDFVTEVDKAAEAEIIDVLSAAYPDHALLAEESGKGGANGADYTWIIDPLDGTTNFIHGFPQYAVSIALRHKDQIEQAVVYDPARNELFTATRGSGAFMNDRRIRVSRRTQLQDCLMATGFPVREFAHVERFLGMFRDVLQKTSGVRRAGAAALDLAWVAAGRVDGFWELGLAPWDMAAGALLVQEAGGLVGDLDGEPGYLDSGNVTAANPKIFVQLLQTFASHLKG
jgi:myo-inositol-1(or 4)-monophosphatase